MESSLKIISTCLKNIPENTVIKSKKHTKSGVNKHASSIDFEVPTGKLELKVQINSKHEITEFEILTPTQKHLYNISNFVLDEDLEDLNIILASLNLDLNEVYKN
jgi:Ni,Fe-hydrogenase III large subunit